MDGIFKYEEDLLKHHVRLEAWLPACRRRLELIREGLTPKNWRRLRYFTFCAVGAMDPLMLDVEDVISASKGGRFNTVYFFDKKPEYVVATQKRIPGAIGFTGDFVDVVLSPDDGQPHMETGNVLAPPPDQQDTSEVRASQRHRSERDAFRSKCPFDAVNLDLEEYLFKPSEQLPGRVVAAMRKLFEWQRRPLLHDNPHWNGRRLSGFSLMFTTRIGPANLSQAYLGALETVVLENLERDEALGEIVRARVGSDDIRVLRHDSFDEFFKLAMPKVIVAILKEEDWYINPDSGLSVIEFDREGPSGPYKMLHLVMQVCRNNPPQEDRIPGAGDLEATQKYNQSVRNVLASKEVQLSEEDLDTEKLQKSIDLIRARRRKYCPEEEEA